ncbi:MAG: hypothetical protein F6J90_41960 [Moorea sp. SIOASIH]|nr:hypothetical protein [Moorena sp. SIOASIH]
MFYFHILTSCIFGLSFFFFFFFPDSRLPTPDSRLPTPDSQQKLIAVGKKTVAHW